MKLKRDWTEIGRWALGKRWRFQVTGNSMLPTLQSSDQVLVLPVQSVTKLSPGDIIICLHPLRPNQRMVKRISETFYDGSCYVLSDNAAEGTDSRSFGVVSREFIVGRVTSLLF